MGGSQNWATFWVVLPIRIIVIQGLYWGSPVHANYHGMTRSAAFTKKYVEFQLFLVEGT